MQMMFGLKPYTINAIRKVFAAYPQIEKVVLYGSRATETHRFSSDIDLAIFGSHLDLTLQQKIETALDDLLLPYKLDVAIFHRINNAKLVEHIQKTGKILYEQEKVI